MNRNNAQDKNQTQMPTIFEYFGIILKFYSNEHDPIHVHALYGKDYEMKVEFHLKKGEVDKIVYKKIKGRKEFPATQLKDLTKLVEKYKNDIVEDRINYVVLKTKVERVKITTKLKYPCE